MTYIHESPFCKKNKKKKIKCALSCVPICAIGSLNAKLESRKYMIYNAELWSMYSFVSTVQYSCLRRRRSARSDLLNILGGRLTTCRCVQRYSLHMYVSDRHRNRILLRCFWVTSEISGGNFVFHI